MDLIEARALLSGQGTLEFSRPEIWADLGCGAGTFTRALATLLPAGSHIEAIDRDGMALDQVPEKLGSVSIRKTAADFIRKDLSYLAPLDGILMANSLHYVRDQQEFIGPLLSLLQQGGRLIIIEYDSDHPNAWVPYPVSFDRLKVLLSSTGYRAHTVKLAEKPSVYGPYNIYSALVSLIFGSAKV